MESMKPGYSVLRVNVTAGSLTASPPPMMIRYSPVVTRYTAEGPISKTFKFANKSTKQNAE